MGAVGFNVGHSWLLKTPHIVRCSIVEFTK